MNQNELIVAEPYSYLSLCYLIHIIPYPAYHPYSIVYSTSNPAYAFEYYTVYFHSSFNNYKNKRMSLMPMRT